jgi:hypothetical protein
MPSSADALHGERRDAHPSDASKVVPRRPQRQREVCNASEEWWATNATRKSIVTAVSDSASKNPRAHSADESQRSGGRHSVGSTGCGFGVAAGSTGGGFGVAVGVVARSSSATHRPRFSSQCHPFEQFAQQPPSTLRPAAVAATALPANTTAPTGWLAPIGVQQVRPTAQTVPRILARMKCG